MSKLYVGNLPSDCNESALRQLFQDNNLSCTTILVKRGGYAFVDCTDQSVADRAIDKLNDKSLITARVAQRTAVDRRDNEASALRTSGTRRPSGGEKARQTDFQRNSLRSFPHKRTLLPKTRLPQNGLRISSKAP
ncbi:hypothetical protein KM043_012522 [Ampulex compressa]|nr:hypothetical protein KM043_012522 [Ampulex compressa]